MIGSTIHQARVQVAHIVSSSQIRSSIRQIGRRVGGVCSIKMFIFFDKQCTIIIFTGHYLDLRIALDKCSSQSCYTSAHRKTSMKNTLFFVGPNQCCPKTQVYFHQPHKPILRYTIMIIQSSIVCTISIFDDLSTTRPMLSD